MKLIRDANAGTDADTTESRELPRARRALRRKIDAASKRPTPGTGSALRGELGDVVAAGHHFKGAWDATGLLPIHLKH